MNLAKSNPPVTQDKLAKSLRTGKLIYAFLAFGFFGFLDATYLTILHYKNIIPPCSISNGCETVLTSSYSTVSGIPVSLLGAGFYISIIVLGILLLTNPKQIFLKALYLMADIGFVVSAILIYIQFGIIKAYCQYCLLSEIMSFLILVTAILIWKDVKTSKKTK